MPDAAIFVTNLEPDKGPPGSVITFMIPPESITISNSSAAASPQPLPANTQFDFAGGSLDGTASSLQIINSACLDSAGYSVFSFTVPEDASEGTYTFAMMYYATLEGGLVFQYQIVCEQEFRVTAGQDTNRCVIRKVTPDQVAYDELGFVALSYSGEALDQIQKNPLLLKHVEAGTIYGAIVTSQTETRIQVKILATADDEVENGQYILRATKTPQAQANSPGPVQILSAATLKIP